MRQCNSLTPDGEHWYRNAITDAVDMGADIKKD